MTKTFALSLALIIVCALVFSPVHAIPISRLFSSQPTPPFSLRQDEPSENEGGALLNLISGWWIVAITVFSSLPWAVVAVLDAIDTSYRTRNTIFWRLFLSSACLLLAYTTGLMFITVLLINTVNDTVEGRYDEVATVLVLLIFNLWHVGRNIRGWLQYAALSKLNPIFRILQTNLEKSSPKDERELRDTVCIQGIDRLRISNRLIDNDWNKETPFLNPFYSLSNAGSGHGSSGDSRLQRLLGRKNRMRRRDSAQRVDPKHHVPDRFEEAWAVAAWRAWWTQDTSVLDTQANDLTVTYSNLRVEEKDRVRVAEDLIDRDVGPNWPRDGGVVMDSSKVCSAPDGSEEVAIIKSREEWARALEVYGGAGGQQDSCGDSLPVIANFRDASGVATVVREKTLHAPNRMTALWYNTARFEEVYEEKREEARKSGVLGRLTLPLWSAWLQIAQDIGTHLSRPVYLSDTHLVNFAGELASASLIITLYAEKYRELVVQIYEDGLNARWTFGWSGLLACFSHLWTTERIHIAMLNGLSLLTLARFKTVKSVDSNVRAMLYGYAAFAVSDRAVGKRIAEDRKAELLKRYSRDKGKTCRGSGVCSTRIACGRLGLPPEASHMDGLPAFGTGWAAEFMEFKPGNDKPEHGDTHDDVEKRHGSSNVWRYPYSHT